MNKKRLFFIVTKRNGREVLLLRTQRGCTLPTFDKSVPARVGFDDPGPYNDWFKGRYGLDVVRRYAIDQPGSDMALFVMEPRVAEPNVPVDALWVGAGDPLLASLHPASLRTLVAAGLVDSADSQTIPWSNPGGYDPAFAWMFETLEQCGLTPVEPPQQVKNAYVSSVFRCRTDRGTVYLKTLPGIFVRELAVTRKLAEWNIVRLPERLASNTEQGWMLMADMGGCDLGESGDVDLLTKVVTRFADIQIASTAHVGGDSPWPFYDWRVPVLRDTISDTVAEAESLLRDSPHQLTGEETARLVSSLPPWQRLCDEIIAAGIPSAIDHGDLRPGNIRVVSGDVVFYDWAWSAVTHPFMALAGFLHIVRDRLCEAANCRLRDSYLERWQDYAPLDDLRRLLDLVDQARVLYGTVADAEWLRCLWRAVDWQTPNPASADAWTLDRRQYYFAKMLRRLMSR
ncbi:MAG: hypothetical protein JXL80_04805 [Planctomycetes bacterium]|nr:hypothetical protein [Planctomycetota bacterium]